MRLRRILRIFFAAVVVVVLAVAVDAFVKVGHPDAVAAGQIASPLPTALLLKPIADTTPNAVQLRRGQYLVLAGDCVACHTRTNATPFTGGYALASPFGVLYTPNLTPDQATGIGSWTPEQFYEAVHDGRAPNGVHLYPGFPYTYFTRVTRADSDAMLAFLKTLPPQAYAAPPDRLIFPFNIRALMVGWNALFFRAGEFTSDPDKSAQWNRGAYLVTGLGHCGSCHTPKNFLAADKNGEALQAGTMDNWTAPDLTANPRLGLGRWSVADVVEYLKTGRNAYANAGGAMAQVVSDSTAAMTGSDLQAIAAYLKDLPASAAPSPAAPDPGAMTRGAAVYSDACASCHMEQGNGQPRFFPPLAADAVAQQNDPTTVLHVILAGDRTAPTPTRPSALSMPTFAWKLDDQQIADVATYVRNSWNNRATAVTAPQVTQLRRKLGLQVVHLTETSGDRD